jgi:parallel beta-helix repeat protein
MEIKGTVHNPIHINGNADFANQAQQEGWAGDGTQGNPYIIEGYDINGNGGTYCIWIENTDVWFVIRNCKVCNATSDASHPWGTGIYLKNVQHGTLVNNNCSGNSEDGISLLSSSNNNITHNNCSGNSYSGISLLSSSNNNITHNYCSNNSYFGIYLRDSSNNKIMNNNCSGNYYGISLYSSSNNTITYNICSGNYYGISLGSSSNNNITYNICSGNSHDGIDLDSSSDNNITNNTLWNNGIVIYDWSLEEWNTHIIENNTVNGKPVYYYKNQNGGTVPIDAGQVILANCTNMVVSGLTLTHASIGVQLGFSSYNNITNNNCSSNSYYGIYLLSSSNNNITYNNFYNNTNYAINITSSSSGNTIHHNNFWQNNGAGRGVNGNSQAYDEVGGNYWYDNTAHEGNYWSNWNGSGWGTANAYPIDGGAGAYDMCPLSNPTPELSPIAVIVSALGLLGIAALRKRK